MLSYAVVLPTLNPGDGFSNLLWYIKNQTLLPKRVIVIDSQSEEPVKKSCDRYNVEYIEIKRSEFNHGATRQLGADILQSENIDVIVYITQDIIIESLDVMKNIMSPFVDNNVGAVCGRQIPHVNANSSSIHLRKINYPEKSKIISISDVVSLGVRAAFMSNSFAAYRVTDLFCVNGFPCNTILGEDTYVAAQMLKIGKKIAYESSAVVRHSHNYTLLQEFKRYFDIGVFHESNGWYLQLLSGTPSGEGRKYAMSELKYCFSISFVDGFRSIFLSICKIMGYKLGRYYKFLPKFIVLRFSMHKFFWV